MSVPAAKTLAIQPVENVATLIVGGGQAGLAMSEQLSKRGLPHLVLERHRIVERWRSERWDGLHANGPAWSDSMPGYPIPGVGLDEFATRDLIVDYFLAYADAIEAPVRCGVEVTALRRRESGAGFRAETSHGPIKAANVVVATGPFQRPVIPAIAPPDAGVFQIHASGYRNPGQLPDGAVLVVGSGSSGAQIAEELMRAGRRVYLSIGRHVRPPRRYRGRDFVWWMDQQGLWHLPAAEPTPEHVPLAFSGAYGGVSVDYRRLAAGGVVLLGRTAGFLNGVLHFARDLAGNLAEGDASCLAFLDASDAFATRLGLDLPDEPEARIIQPDPPCVTDPILEVSLRDAGIGSIVWATGYALDFGWLDVPVCDARGAPLHRRGVTAVPGLYFLGLAWLSKRTSSFICGVGEDAAWLAERIAGGG
ncbi:MAG: FAD-dependent oxidoreductase [Acetobacteraceae bacterium]|nr:FAD-dependent oxidoreductase [Acetobacteraceae bacterium]